MHAAYKRCDNSDVITLGQDKKMMSLTHFGFPLAVLGNKKLIRPTNQVFIHKFMFALRLACFILADIFCASD